MDQDDTESVLAEVRNATKFLVKHVVANDYQRSLQDMSTAIDKMQGMILELEELRDGKTDKSDIIPVNFRNLYPLPATSNLTGPACS